MQAMYVQPAAHHDMKSCALVIQTALGRDDTADDQWNSQAEMCSFARQKNQSTTATCTEIKTINPANSASRT
jgi:hypothetical protein